MLMPTEKPVKTKHNHKSIKDMIAILTIAINHFYANAEFLIHSNMEEKVWTITS
jgi:hypothetical protein